MMDYFLSIFLSIAATIILAVGVFFVSFGLEASIHAPGKKTDLWGMEISSIQEIDKAQFRGVLGWILIAGGMVMACGNFFYTWIEIFWDGTEFILMISWLFPLLAIVISMIVVFAVIKPKKWLDRTLASARNALPFGQMTIIRDVESKVNEAEIIALCSDGIRLYDKKGYNYFSVQYGDYKLGNIDSGDKLLLLGCYFRQRYNGIFEYSAKVDTTFIDRINITSTGTGYTYVNSSSIPVANNVKEIYFIRK